jgi:3-oxochol-4-en-24-oyl-CoA dehydrogenase
MRTGMPLGLSPEQQQLADAVSEFAARHAPIDKTRRAFDSLAAGQLPPWWQDLVVHGFHAVHLPDDVGGQGGQLADMACVIEAAANALLPGPLLSTATASAVALLATGTPAADSLIGDLAAGATAALVLPDHSDFRAMPDDGGGWLVSGSSGLTVGICSAQKIIFPAGTKDDGYIWLALDNTASKLRVEPRRSTDLTTDVGVLRLEEHVIPNTFVLKGIDAERARCIAVALASCAAAGATRWCVEAVTAHLKTREQFGRPIGSFQALQHRAAMLLVNSELATSAAWDAVPCRRGIAGPASARCRRGGHHGGGPGTRPGARRADDVRRDRLHMGT